MILTVLYLDIDRSMRNSKTIPLFSILLTVILCLCTCKQQEPISLTLLSYNIHHGEGMDTILDLSRIARIIETQNPDLVGLQEVDFHCRRSDSVDQTAFLAKVTGLAGSFGKFMDLQEGEYGMATLSGLPVISTKVLPLPDAKFEPRSAIVQEIQIADDASIVFANVHFEWITGEEGSANRLKQAKALVAYVDSLAKPTIIIGDFNCTPDSPSMQYFAKNGFFFVPKGPDKLSYQGEHKSEIDHVIYRNSGNIRFAHKKAMLLDEPIASDHRPLVVEIEATIK